MSKNESEIIIVDESSTDEIKSESGYKIINTKK